MAKNANQLVVPEDSIVSLSASGRRRSVSEIQTEAIVPALDGAVVGRHQHLIESVDFPKCDHLWIEIPLQWDSN